MSIFNIKGNQLLPIKESKIDLEKDLQKITEENLETIFGLKFVSTEFQLNNLRIDTLAYDEETKSFVIIEFKRDRSFSVIDQGYAYLALMLNNKADFILEYNEKMKDNLKREDIDWSQSRVLFLANSFTNYQQNAINFKDLPIELWEVKKYDNDTILYKQLKAADTKESIKTVSKSKTIEGVSKEVKKYTVEDLFKANWKKGRELYEILREKIYSIDEKIEEKFTKLYVAYRINNKNFCEVVPRMNSIQLFLDFSLDDFTDPRSVLKDCSNIGHWATGNVKFDIMNEKDIDYAMFLIKQVYERFYK